MQQRTSWDVFVSHNRQEKPWIRQLVGQWREIGINVFFDEDSIDPGENVVSGIDRGLNGSRHVVLVITPASIQSKWVAMEAANAIYSDPDSKLRRLIPVLLERIPAPSVPPSIRGLKWIDLSDTENRQRNYHQLLKFLGVSATHLPDPPTLKPIRGGDVTSASIEPAIENEIALVSEEIKTKETSLIEIKIDRDFRDFNDDDQKNFMASVKELLKVGSVKIISKRVGSVILTLELTREQTTILLGAVKAGYFKEHRVSEALILEKALAERTEEVAMGVEQYVAIGAHGPAKKGRASKMREEAGIGWEDGTRTANDLLKNSSLYREFQAEREAILRHKWIESEKAGHDIGFERALTDWIINKRSSWRKTRQGTDK